MKKLIILTILANLTYSDLNSKYIVQEKLKPSGLINISDEQIDDHWKLYKGYIENVNKLDDELDKMRQDGDGATLNYSDRRRRYDFEFNGMVLHEYYFANLTKNKKYKKVGSNIQDALKDAFGSYEAWAEDFKQAGKTRGIGWAVLCMDPQTHKLINIFVADHENGNIASFIPILVMDVWEHAYMVDYFASQRPDYIEAFMKNINWFIVEKRFNSTKNSKLVNRYQKYSLKKPEPISEQKTENN